MSMIARLRRRSATARVAATMVVACCVLGLQASPTLASATAAARSHATETDTVEAIETTVTTLFSALREGNYAAACNQYTAADQHTLIAAAAKLFGRSFSECSAALAAIYHASPAIAAEFRHLGAPHYSDISIHGNTATLVYVSTVGKLAAHSEIIVEREAGRWLVGRATSLTFTKR